MLKCPNCGSTAQVERKEPFFSKETNRLVVPWECGCGCHYVSEYEEDEKGVFIHYTTFIEFVDAKTKTENKGHIHCPANAWNCPYWKDGICSMYSAEEGWLNPIDECDDFGYFWDEDDDFIDYD